MKKTEKSLTELEDLLLSVVGFDFDSKEDPKDLSVVLDSILIISNYQKALKAPEHLIYDLLYWVFMQGVV